MNAQLINRIETNAQRGAAALFAAACAYGVFSLLQPGSWRFGSAAGAGLVAYLVSALAMKVVAGPRLRFKVPVFDLREFDPFEAHELLLTDKVNDEPAFKGGAVPDELLLTDDDRLRSEDPSSEPLVLDDVLAAVGRDSRVVRLFDRQAMPTPGQLSSTIDGHLESKGSRTAQSDAAQALSEALAELRRSLR